MGSFIVNCDLEPTLEILTITNFERCQKDSELSQAWILNPESQIRSMEVCIFTPLSLRHHELFLVKDSKQASVGWMFVVNLLCSQKLVRFFQQFLRNL